MQKTPEEIASDLVRGAIKKKRRKRNRMSHVARLRRYFFAGLLVVTPLVLTLWIVVWLVNLIDGNTRKFLGSILDRAGLKYHISLFGNEYEVFPIGFGLILVFVTVCFVGMIASNYVGRRLFLMMDALIRRVPGVSWIYNAIHQVSHAFLNRNKDLLREVVYIEYPRRGIYAIGFVTNHSLPGVTTEMKEEIRTVFLPTTPNPTSGFLLLIPASGCIPCSMTVEDSMKMIISGGVVVPESLQTQKTQLPFLDDATTVAD
jgi:uncharacterized membrane protein